MCTGLLLYGGQAACFTDSANSERSGWMGFVDQNSQRGGSQSVHTDVLV